MVVREGRKKLGKMDRRISGRSKRAGGSERCPRKSREREKKRGRRGERVARKGIRESEMLPW